MRGTHPTVVLTALLALAAGCLSRDQPEPVAVEAASLAERTARRAYDGAPPVIPHEPLGMSCTECHGERSLTVPNLGIAPASPHETTPGLSNLARCQQCHVFARAGDEFRASDFEPVASARSTRLFDGAPPTVPHPVFMRENCAACHSGPAARPEIVTSHPDRTRCLQCHVPVKAEDEFRPVSGAN